MTRKRNAIKQSKKRANKTRDDVLSAQRLIKYFGEGEQNVVSISKVSGKSRNSVYKYMVDWDSI